MGEEHTKESDPNVKIYKEVEQSRRYGPFWTHFLIFFS